jgi:Co/Zn/Cd efflux system component
MTTIPVFRDCMRILMEVQPNTVDSINLKREIERIEDVKYVEDMHVWALAGSKNIMTVHVTLK